MSKFFEEGQIPLEKVVRFSAVNKKYKPLGCLESHTEVIKLAKKEGWKNVMILEDDMEWVDFKEGYSRLVELTKLPDWDVILLVGWYYEYNFPRIYFSNNAGAYLVNEAYQDTLLKNRELSLNKLKLGIGFDYKNPKYYTDVYWSELMAKDIWYGLNPCICRQVDGFSDINNRIVESSKVVGIFSETVRKSVYKP